MNLCYDVSVSIHVVTWEILSDVSMDVLSASYILLMSAVVICIVNRSIFVKATQLKQTTFINQWA